MVTAQPLTETTFPPPPMIPGVPFVGNALNMVMDPLQYLVEQYHNHGPVFRIRLLNRKVTILAGPEANRFLAKNSDDLGSELLFGGFAAEMGSKTLLVSMDGPEHRALRKVMSRGFSRSALVPFLETLIDDTKQRTADWKSGDTVPILPFARRMVADQLGIVTTGRPPGDVYDDILLYFNTMLNVEALKTLPRLAYRRPGYKAAKARALALGHEVLAAHRQNPPDESDRHRDLIDDVLESDYTFEDGSRFSEDDLAAMAIGPYFAGLDTVASTLSFLLYTIHKYPDVHRAIMAEIDAIFADGTPTYKDFRQAKTLAAAIQETLRMYPVTPFTPRTAEKAFDFHGYHVATGSELYFAQTVTHYLEEYYPDPYTFDVSRYENGNPHTAYMFAPYTLGAHSCLGAGMADAYLMVMTAALLRHVDFSLESPDYTVKIYTMPLPNPGQRFRLMVRGQREL